MNNDNRKLIETESNSSQNEFTAKKFKSKLPPITPITKDIQNIKLLVISWNLMGSLPDQKNLRALFNAEDAYSKDIIIIGTQQCQRSLCISFICESKQKWEYMIDQQLNKKFEKIESEVLQGLHLIGFVNKVNYGRITHIRKSKLKTGFCGVIGNKGATQLIFNFDNQAIQFINCHLDASQQDPLKRNADLQAILQNLVNTELAHHSILFGDLNYRIEISLQQAKKIQSNDYLNYKNKDQLKLQKQLKQFLNKFRQGQINFLPTYKVDTNVNQYNDKRVPGWTDRIFYHSIQKKTFELTKYTSNIEIYGSDHRPVLGHFQLKLTKQKQKVEQEFYVPVRNHQRCNLM